MDSRVVSCRILIIKKFNNETFAYLHVLVFVSLFVLAALWQTLCMANGCSYWCESFRIDGQWLSRCHYILGRNSSRWWSAECRSFSAVTVKTCEWKWRLCSVKIMCSFSGSWWYTYLLTAAMTYLCGITVDELCECSSEACVECSLTFGDVDVIVNADVQCQQAWRSPVHCFSLAMGVSLNLLTG